MRVRIGKMATHKKRTPFRVLLFPVLGSCSALLILEVIFRFLPVHNLIPGQVVDKQHPVARYSSNRTFSYSLGPFFSNPNSFGTNNKGFVSEIDYKAKRTKPLLALIGDSYVEAKNVAPQSTVAAILRKRQGQYETYSFGHSGAPLSQYLAYARYARDEFLASKFVFVLIGNDYDESLFDYKRIPRFHVYRPDSNGTLELTRLDYTPTTLQTTLTNSALVSYLVENLALKRFFVAGAAKQSELLVGDTRNDLSKTRLEASKRAVDAFLRDLESERGFRLDSVLFIQDAVRPQLYENNAEQARSKSFAGIMHDYFATQARTIGFRVETLDSVFLDYYRRTGKRVEGNLDNHWNAEGHNLVANTILADRELWNERKILP